MRSDLYPHTPPHLQDDAHVAVRLGVQGLQRGGLAVPLQGCVELWAGIAHRGGVRRGSGEQVG